MSERWERAAVWVLLSLLIFYVIDLYGRVESTHHRLVIELQTLGHPESRGDAAVAENTGSE